MAQFGVDWQHVAPGVDADPRHQRRRRDERLLFGEGQSLPAFRAESVTGSPANPRTA